MSALYNLEPQPTAKVLLQTTSGDILLELFAKQVPLASRNFLQLCLDGYYDNTLFHRLVPGFIIQGGDPTGTGNGGEAIYDGGLFADEFHSRLKFNRRGLLGMANTGKDDNGSQFFLTLGKTEELNGRNTMFGRIVGDTIYNLMKMGEAELSGGEGSERPLYPTKITGTEILVNPFEDMVKREVRKPAEVKEAKSSEAKKTKKKATKTLLSFGGEDGEEEEGPVLKKAKFNPKLVSAGPDTSVTSNDRSIKKTSPIRQRNEVAATQPTRTIPPRFHPKAASPETQLPLRDEEKPSRSSSSAEPEDVKRMTSALERTNAQIAELKASMRRHVSSAGTESSRKKSALEEMIPEHAVRGRKRKTGNTSTSDAQALKLLNAFRTKLEQAPPEAKTPAAPETNGDIKAEHAGQEVANDDEEALLCDLHFIANCQSCKSWDEHAGPAADDEYDDKGWMSHALSFEKDRLGKDLTWKKKNEEELVVIDPREKAKSIKEEQRIQKMSKKQPSTKAWDRDRDGGRAPAKVATSRG